MAKKNLLFLMTDHQRADSLGMVQAGVEVAPMLNRLAAEGATFSRCYNTCPLCVPARTALFTGLYPTRTGVVVNGRPRVPRESLPNCKPMHQYLAEAGYSVAHIGVPHIRTNPPLQERVEFAAWEDNRSYRRYAAGQGIDEMFPGGIAKYQYEVSQNEEGEIVKRPYSSPRTAVWPHPLEDFKDIYWCRKAIEFLRQPHEGPFALFLYLWAPHPPLVLPEPYASMFDLEKLDLPPNVGQTAEGEPPGRRNATPAQVAEGVTMDEWRLAWAAHFGLVRMADDALGTVLDALQECGRADQTIVTFTVDHGDHMGQHRLYQKMECYEQAIRTPLVIRAPGNAPQRFDAPVWHLDVMPTLMDLLGLEMSAEVDGVSLAASVQAGAPPPERTLFCEYSGNSAVGDIRRAAITRRYKYVYDPNDLPELFDLEVDPLEMHNLASDPAHAEILRDLHAQCAAWGGESDDWVDY